MGTCRMARVTLNNGLGSFNFDPGVVSPVVTTPPRVSGQDALKHILDKVLCLPNDSGIRDSLKAGGFVKSSQVIGMSEATMTVLFHVAKEKETLQALQRFAYAQNTHLGHTLTPDDWLKVTADMFDAYRLHHKPWLPAPKEKKNWGCWQQCTHTSAGCTAHAPNNTVRRLVTPAHTVPSLLNRMKQLHESYPDSNMGRGHDCVDHPVMTSSPEVLVKDQSPAALQNMMPLNCAHGESQKNTNRHVENQDETSGVTTCDPTHYALVHGRKFGVSLVNHETNGGTAHVEEDIENHQVCDVPMFTTSGVFKSKDDKVVGSTLTIPHIPAGHDDKTPVDMSNVTTRIQDWDMPVFDGDPHEVLQASDDADATEALTVHDNFNQYGEYMDRNMVAPASNDISILKDKVPYSTMKFRHVDIVEEGIESFLKDENNQDIYKYIVVYVDDLAMTILRPAEFTQLIIDKYKFKLTGIGPTSLHLECELVSNKEGKEGTLCLKPLEQMYGEMPGIKVTSSIFEKKKNMELVLYDVAHHDMDEIIKHNVSIVDSFQWILSLGRNDIITDVVTLPHFRSMPRKGHLFHIEGVVSYFKKMCDSGIQICRTHEPDDPGIPLVEHDLATSIYGELSMVFVPSHLPSPNNNMVTLTWTVGANLDPGRITTGHSVIGIQHSINDATPIGWYSKHQSMVETATYGSEIAAHAYVEQVTDLHNVTCYHLGVPIHGTNLMFDNNRPVVESLSQPLAMWHKRHTELSSHLVRGAITTEDIIVSYHIPREDMSWGYQHVWQLLQPLIIWQVDTVDIAKHSLSLAKG